MSKIPVPMDTLSEAGIEVLPRGPAKQVALPRHTVLEAPGSLKWTEYDHSIEMGAFSYQVSGYCFAARIGRYCSFGEDVQIGRQNHPMTWISTSPAFYLGDRLFELGGGFAGAEDYHSYKFSYEGPPTRVRITTIGNDVWIGHGAFIAAGVTIGHGAVIGAQAVVTKDVPPYAVMAGNPATLKRWRVDPMLVTPMLRSRWWRFAPWQLSHLDPSRPKQFVQGINEMDGTPDYAPDIFDLRIADTGGGA
ncbi:MAG: CatB-related O-acetyltransferase [Marinibacterium sp.]